ncbi:PQQ-binding-like beta-propeller repeat protein [Halopelagius fulvigenes]|uniref:PQQ-binding-like beta-propeller repeat protein n=1 Tax=Halopelagius fulvigenes TaxID=1198324 RepID=A0ABD5U500_9EURY
MDVRARGRGRVLPRRGRRRIYVCSPGPTYALSRPSPLGAPFGGGPSPAWERGSPGPGTWPVVTDGRVLVGDGGLTTETDRTHSLSAFDVDGEGGWTSSANGSVVGLAVSEAESLAVSVRFGAVAGEGTVEAVETATGETAWERDDIDITDEFGGSVAVAGDICLVAGYSEASANPVRALDAATGETRWRRTVEGDVTAVVLAGGRVYAATTLGSLVAFE